LSQVHNIESLDVSANLFLDIVLENVITLFPQQKFERLRQVSYSDEGNYTIAPFLHLQSLKELSLGGGANDMAYEGRLDVPQSVNAVERLTLCNKGLGDEVHELCERCPNLRYLTFDIDTEFDDMRHAGDIPKFLQCLAQNCKQLKSLEITFTDPFNVHVIDTPMDFDPIRNLRSLRFGGAKFDISGMQTLHLTSSGKIRIVDLAGQEHLGEW